MKQTINDFINSIDTKLYIRIRASKGDAECRRYLKEHLAKQCDIHVVSKSVTAKDLKCPSCKKHCLITYIDGKECTSCGYVC